MIHFNYQIKNLKKELYNMKKFGFVLLISAIMLVCMLSITASAFVFPGISGFPSTISSGNIGLIAGILLVAIIAAVIIIKKVKSKNKNDK